MLGWPQSQRTPTTWCDERAELRAFWMRSMSGALTPRGAHERLLQFLRQAPFEDLGFARSTTIARFARGVPKSSLGLERRRTDCRHRRTHRRGRPQPARHTHGPSLIRGRRGVARRRIPRAGQNHYARAGERRPAAAPLSSQPLARLTCRSPKKPRSRPSSWAMPSIGSTTSASPDSIGCSPSTPRLTAARVIIVVAGMEGPCRASSAGLVERPGRRRADQRRLRRELWRAHGPAGDAQ